MCAQWKGANLLCSPQLRVNLKYNFYSGLHALANRLVLHVFSSSHCVIFANVTFSSLVCSLFATWLSPYIMHGDCSSWCTRPTSQFTGHRMRLLKSNTELDMLSAFKSFLTLMFLCCRRQRASPLSPLVVSQAAAWFREACAIVDLVCLGFVVPCDWRTCGVVQGPRCVSSLFKFAFGCVYQFVHLFRDADCVVCLLLSVIFCCGRLALLFEGRYRAIFVGRGCGAGFVGAVARPCFVYVSCFG